jgi:TIR domain-containing protein
MGAPVFISYGHADQVTTDWLSRLQSYLAQSRRSGGIDAWDDRRISAGEEWRVEIKRALNQAVAAVLLVGPAFLASRFIRNDELAPLLRLCRDRGVRIFPLIVGWCDFEDSDLEPFQAFNDPKKPLESLSISEQNRILNQLSIEVSKAIDTKALPSNSTWRESMRGAVLREPIVRLAREMELSASAFSSQNKRCRELVDAVTKRVGIKEHLEFEKFLFRYHQQMNAEELFEFQMIRAVTDGPLAECNRKMLDILMDHAQLLAELPALTGLRQHLVFWLNKYERVFRSTPAMAVCYVGVEDGVPWPSDAESAVRGWIRAHPPDPD